MEFEIEVIEKRWAPTIVVEPKRDLKYLNQADLYEQIYDRIIELDHNYGVWFKVDYRQTTLSGNRTMTLTVFYGGLHDSFVLTPDSRKRSVDGGGFITRIAHMLADEVVFAVYGR